MGQHYATLFFGLYDDAARRLTYVNCGHNPPFWIRADGRVQRLAATATVIGLFERWDCAVASIDLAPADLLAIFSDGVSEAERGDEEFGEVLRGQRDSLDQPPDHDQTLHGVLREAFEDARTHRRGDQLRTMLQMLWADELLETQRQVQADLAGSVPVAWGLVQPGPPCRRSRFGTGVH